VATASPTVATIYQRVRPSVVVVSTGDKLGSGGFGGGFRGGFGGHNPLIADYGTLQ
jgi:hypothetical protein